MPRLLRDTGSILQLMQVNAPMRVRGTNSIIRIQKAHRVRGVLTCDIIPSDRMKHGPIARYRCDLCLVKIISRSF